MERACKPAFSYGMESDPKIVAKFLSMLNLKERHAHIPAQIPKAKPPTNYIPPKAVTYAFSGMPKMFAARRDGWTCEVLGDAAHTRHLRRPF